MCNSYTHYTGELTPSDLDLVVSAMEPACDKWYGIGLALNLKRHDLERILLENFGMLNDVECLSTVISLWLKQVSPPSTWSSLVVALRQPQLGLRSLANLIEEEHVLEKIVAKGESNYCFLQLLEYRGNLHCLDRLT